MLKILLVDDEFTERDGMKFLIEKFKLPLEVAEAENGKKALAYIKTHPVDILLTDVRMPYMDGLELAKEVSVCSPDTVIIIFSAYSEFEYAKKACEVNAVNYLLKPIELDEFEQVMTRVIKRLEERERQKKEQENLKQSEKKYLLYQMFKSQTFQPKQAERLKAYDFNMDYRYMVCISVETGRNFFELHEEEFESFLKEHFRYSCEQVSLLPNQSYILLYSYKAMDEDGISRDVKQLYEFLTEDEMKVSIFVGKSFYGVEEFPTRLKALEELREQLFHYTFGIRREAELDLSGEELRREQLAQKEMILEAVAAKNLQLVREGMSAFISMLEKSKSVSAIYSKYVIVDIMKVLFDAYGIYNAEFLLQVTDRIMKCVTVWDMRQVLTDYLDKLEKQEERKSEGQSSTVAEIKRIVRNEYMLDLSLEDIAGKVCLAPGYVSCLFKQETGQNLVKYVTDYRMEQAREMLMTQSRKITDIARACGYQNQSYFNKLFKNYYGLTPKQFREQRE